MRLIFPSSTPPAKTESTKNLSQPRVVTSASYLVTPPQVYVTPQAAGVIVKGTIVVEISFPLNLSDIAFKVYA